MCSIGENTHRIKLGYGQLREGHDNQLRAREPDILVKHVSLEYTAHQTDSDDHHFEQDKYTVEKIPTQRPNPSGPGPMRFKVRWRGCGPSHNSWEPISSTLFMQCVRRHKSKLQSSLT